MSTIFPSRRATNPAPYHGSDRPGFDPVPQPLTSFVGRDREIGAVVDLLRRPDVRLLTVTGTGGVGKTRLALRIADESQDNFEDGTLFVSLAAVRDPPMLLPTVALRLGVPDAPGQPLISRLQAYLATKNLLLVLDNVEHLLDAVPTVVDLLGMCPRLTILCTSRTSLNVSGEHLVPLSPLLADEARGLFLERVHALVPGFTLTDELIPVVDTICARVDGLPLAIELAASRIPALPPRAILTRLEHRLDLLTNGPRDAPPRLRGMRDAIGWSHDLLPQKQQVLFRRLGVFIGGFTLEAAQAIAGDGIDVLDAISALVAANLVVPTAGVADDPRFTMLETIREYALERLAGCGEGATVRARHAEYFRSLAENTLPLYDGPDIRLASDRVDIELDNCRVAMTWALEERAAETGIRLAGALWRIWWFAQATGGRPWMERVAEGRSWTERMLTMQDGLPVEAVTEALTGAGALAFLQGDIDHAHTRGERLLERARAGGYRYGEFWALGVLGVTAEKRGDAEQARTYYAQALAIAPTVRNAQNHLAIAHFRLGLVALRTGNMAEATRHLEESLRISHTTGNRWIIAETAAELGRALRQQGDFGRAAEVTREGLLGYAAQRDTYEVHESLADLAMLAVMTGQPERASRLLGAADMFPGPPDKTAALAEATTDARTRLGEAAFTAASETGRHLAWEDVLAEIDELVEAAVDAPVETPPDPAAEHGLSRRETEVLQMLAEGPSNRAIAETLSLSERTVENHVFHIFTKLNVSSRAAAATYAVRHGLL